MTDDLLKIESLDDMHRLAWALEALARTCQDLCAAQADPPNQALIVEHWDRMLALLMLSGSLLSHLRTSLDRLATCRMDPDDAGAAVTGPSIATACVEGEG